MATSTGYQLRDTAMCERLNRANPTMYYYLIIKNMSFEPYEQVSLDYAGHGIQILDFLKTLMSPLIKCLQPDYTGVMDGAPLTHEGICQVSQLIQYMLNGHNLKSEGIFERRGNPFRQYRLRRILNGGRKVDLRSSVYTVYDCAAVLKGFLANLPEPLFTEGHLQTCHRLVDTHFVECHAKGRRSRLLTDLQLLIRLLPDENRALLTEVIQLFNLITKFETHNKTSAAHLASVFTPHLVCPRYLKREDLLASSAKLSKLVIFMIKKGPKLFWIPKVLAADVEEYWACRPQFN